MVEPVQIEAVPHTTVFLSDESHTWREAQSGREVLPPVHWFGGATSFPSELGTSGVVLDGRWGGPERERERCMVFPYFGEGDLWVLSLRLTDGVIRHDRIGSTPGADKWATCWVSASSTSREVFVTGLRQDGSLAGVFRFPMSAIGRGQHESVEPCLTQTAEVHALSVSNLRRTAARDGLVFVREHESAGTPRAFEVATIDEPDGELDWWRLRESVRPHSIAGRYTSAARVASIESKGARLLVVPWTSAGEVTLTAFDLDSRREAWSSLPVGVENGTQMASLLCVPDIDGDSVADVCLVLPDELNGPAGDEGSASGRLLVLSGETGDVLLELWGAPGSRLGGRVCVSATPDESAVWVTVISRGFVGGLLEIDLRERVVRDAIGLNQSVFVNSVDRGVLLAALDDEGEQILAVGCYQPRVPSGTGLHFVRVSDGMAVNGLLVPD